ncbi:PDZ domain-containing protein [Pseudomonas japonica]|uniref:PDZ domain-containing protein n=1 Tax=Pseudomonas japonica TaxID=256466 RepID=UPI003816E719
MKRMLVVVAGMLVSGLGLAVEPNSTYFEVRDFYYPTANGDYQNYSASGYRQAPSPGVAPTLLLLPTITVDKQGIKFFRNNGTAFDPQSEPDTPVGLITIKPKSVSTMPNNYQTAAIASVLDGQSVDRYLPVSLKNAGMPVMTQEAFSALPIRIAIQDDYIAYDARLAGQEKAAQQYHDYAKQNVALRNVEVQLLIAGTMAASRKYQGSLSSLGEIALLAPTEFQVNQIREGSFELMVVSRFQDTKTSSIHATFNAVQAVNSFVEETQQALTKSRSSGFQVFGIGSRRSTLSTSINQTMQSNDKVQVLEKTQIVMHDASDEMVARFESQFFPELAKQEVIDRHLAASAEARKVGNLELAKVHADYAVAIKEGDKMKEVDGVAAAAALSAGDYAGFLAHGVRAINSNNTKADNFRRLERMETIIEHGKIWDQVSVVSVSREISVPVVMPTVQKYAPRVGICAFRHDVDYQWVALNAWNMPQLFPLKGVMVSCVEANSPAALAGLIPGMFLRSVGGNQVQTVADVAQAILDREPGDVISFRVAQSPSPSSPVSTIRVIDVASKRGPAL